MALASVNSRWVEIAGAMLTDVGRVRKSNEDFCRLRHSIQERSRRKP